MVCWLLSAGSLGPFLRASNKLLYLTQEIVKFGQLREPDFGLPMGH
jgi:hypothetical protein